MENAAKRIGLTASEIEELSVPTYDLDEVGSAKFTFADAECEIRVDGIDVDQYWQKGGKTIASIPKSIKEQYPEELKEISKSIKDLRKMLPAQKYRIENLYLAPEEVEVC